VVRKSSFSFGELLKELREYASITQTQLAEKLSTSQDTISLWERGKSFPDYWHIRKLAEAFSVSADILLGLTEY